MPARDPAAVHKDVERFNKAISDERKERKRQREAEKHQKVIDEAEKAKQEAAAEVRRLIENPKASRERREQADANYRHAVAVWKALVAGEEPPPDPREAAAGSAEAASDGPADSTPDDSTPDDSASADVPAEDAGDTSGDDPGEAQAEVEAG